jgi:hypothetical protein
MEKSKKTVKKFIKIKLTQERLAVLAKELGTEAQTMGEIKIEKAERDAEIKNKLKVHEINFARIVTTINDGEEEIEAECIETKDFKKDLVQYHFGGRMVEERPMTDEDRQGVLFSKEEVKKAKARKVKLDDDTSVKSVIKMETNKKTKRDLSVG